jgi:hypothetical protein
MHPHAKLIDRLGGSRAVAQALDLKSPGALQRVSNWKRRGIPELLMLKRPDVFAERANADAQSTEKDAA